MSDDDRIRLTSAIRDHNNVQLAYRRLDGSTSLHLVAPIDIRHGNTPATEAHEYLWAFCYAESRAEMHRCEGILTVRVMDTAFEPAELLSNWPVERWPLPSKWQVARRW